jgi:hypothetical protein
MEVFFYVEIVKTYVFSRENFKRISVSHTHTHTHKVSTIRKKSLYNVVLDTMSLHLRNS